jgi:ubiquinone/menaquinone biosynthesis C-methylase UbiE/protein tyrosine phosphatase (PTP) superfamily phosphohydrolase (DUF442 family)
MNRFFLTLALLIGVQLGNHGLCQDLDPKNDSAPSSKVQPIQIGQIRNLNCVDELYCSGAINQTDISLLKDHQFERIISLRAASEIDWSEKDEAEMAGIQFLQIPISGPAALTDDVFDRIRQELKNNPSKTLLHCGAGGRVAAVCLPYRVLDQGVPLETAIVEAEALGLYNAEMKNAALNYIKRSQAAQKTDSAMPASRQETNLADEKSVKPGINDSFLDENLDVDQFVERFEIESREIFVAREKILAACQLKKGMVVADIGAGTGLFSRMFSVAVGDEGWVYAIDIAPRFLEHINQEATRFGLTNITSILCTDKSAHLPPGSTDVVFVCDTYHHFEYPASTLKSIYGGLKPGGILVIVDFERIPGVSREWTLNHVRAGKEVVRQEIEAAGFEWVEEKEIPGLEENYFLRFRKPLLVDKVLIQ